MSVALRLVERLAVVDHADECVVVFVAALVAPMYQRGVSIRPAPDGRGKPVVVSRPRGRA